MCQVEVDIAWIKNKKSFQASKVLPTKYAFQKREEECEWQGGWLMNKYFSAKLMKAMFTAHTYLFTPPFLEPFMRHGRQCVVMALKSPEPSNCKLR